MAGEKARRKGYLLIEIKLHAWCVAKWTEKYVSYISGTSKCVEIQLLPSRTENWEVRRKFENA